MSNLSKRKWDGLETVNEGKWFTGYDGDVFIPIEGVETSHCSRFKLCNRVDHSIKTLKVKPVCTSRGRSSAIMVWEDSEGFQYNMSLSGGFTLIQLIVSSGVKIDIADGYITTTFVQTKQGANYFIEVYADE